jgi:hypothetical protein
MANMGDTQSSGADEPQTRKAAEAELSARVSRLVTGSDAEAGRVDAIAGSEFSDDRLRFAE